MIEGVASPDVLMRLVESSWTSAHPDLPPSLVVSSVSLCDLKPTLCGAPCVLELRVGRHSYLTDPLLPSATENGGACTIYFESPHIFPFTHPDNDCAPRPPSGSVGNPNPIPNLNPSGHSAAHAPLETGVHVTLRAASHGAAAALGTALCCASGAWAPLVPCGGSVCVTFCLRRDAASIQSRSSFPSEANRSKDVMPCIRHAASADGSPVSGAPRRGWKSVPGVHVSPSCAAVVLGDSAAHTPSHPSTSSSPSPAPAPQSLPAREVSFKRLASCRAREGQPRNLVFSHFCVGGFRPLAPDGHWRLDIMCPHPQLADTPRSLHIPAGVGVDLSPVAELRETVTVELPLFLRGEVQMHISAVWCDGVGQNGGLTPPQVQLVFDPVRVDVQESESCGEVERRRSLDLTGANVGFTENTEFNENMELTNNTEFDETMELTENMESTENVELAQTTEFTETMELSELIVRMRVALEFHEPLREGHNGRPTSAFPQRRSKPRCGSPCSDKGVERGHVHTYTGKCAAGFAPKQDSLLLPRFNCTTPSSPLPHMMVDSRQAPAALWHSVGRVVRAPATIPPMRAVRDLVPCFDEAQRRIVFDMYDTKKQGTLTREQLLHFCRAHVALFDAEQSDASVLQSLWPYVSDGLSHNAYPSAKPMSAGGVRAGSARGAGRSAVSLISRSVSRPQSASTASVRMNRLDNISYEVFALIALRLSGM